VLSDGVVLPHALVQTSETCLRRRRLSLPVAYVLNNRIVTLSAVESNIASRIPDTPSTEDSEFWGIDATEMYLTPLGTWRRAQHPSANGIEFRQVVVE